MTMMWLVWQVFLGPGIAQDNLVHTYSIVARDSVTGEFGVAVQSHWFSVGSVVSWAEAGIGAIATQSLVNVSFGPRGLELLKSGKCAQDVVNELLESDEGREVRQLAVIDRHGHVATHTGSMCIPAAGHYIGHGYSVQANLMLNDKVWPAMAKAFETARSPLAERMLAALEAGENAGGDIRGSQSAAILVVKPQSTGKVWEDRLIDLRVEDHADPIGEMNRLLSIHRAYEFMNNGDLAMEKNDVEAALKYYASAESLFPGNLEMQYWHAVSLANAGLVDRALPIFSTVFSKDENWRVLTRRLPAVKLLNVNGNDLERILQVK